MTVRVSAHIAAAHTGRIFETLHIGDFYQNSSINLKFLLKSEKILGTREENLYIFGSNTNQFLRRKNKRGNHSCTSITGLNSFILLTGQQNEWQTLLC